MANTSPSITADQRKQEAEFRRLNAEIKSGSLDKFYAGMMANSFTKFLARAALTIKFHTKDFFPSLKLTRIFLENSQSKLRG